MSYPICTFESNCECLTLNEKGELIGLPSIEDCIYCSALDWVKDKSDIRRIDITTKDLKRERE